jgi:beta-glucosidase
MHSESFRSRFHLRSLCLALTTVIGLASTQAQQTLEDRITGIINQMTTAEKILQLHQQGGMNTEDNTRLNIPGFLMDDGPHGVRDGNATSFPVGIGMASSWDVDLAKRIGIAMGKEFRGKGRHQALGPCLDLDRDPRNGRSPETGGEDPYLDAQITTAVVKGIQTTPTIATVKHYNGNSRENGRTSNNVIVSQRLLQEHYGLAFRTAVQQGGAFCVMNAYNLINGQKCAENPNLLTSILKNYWGFPGYVVSDWASIWNSELAIEAGCDICMGSDNYKNDLPGLVSGGQVSMAVLDEAVRRVLRTKFLSGMMDINYPAGNPSDVNSVEHQKLCLEAGRKSLVLLKNNGNILPLSKQITKLALVGPNAAVCLVDARGSSEVYPFYSVSPQAGITTKIGAGKVAYTRGCDVNSSDTSGFADAASVAAGADVVVFCGGLDKDQEGEGADRATGSIDLPGKQLDLIDRLAAVNPNLIVVLYSGGVCGLDRSINNIKGLIQAFYPGQESGNAIADVLFGDYNPGGKLPVTWPKTDAQLPAWNDNFNDDYGCGYRWFDTRGIIPEFPFGFGLSYTTFSYSNLRISPATIQPGEPVTVSVDVTNSGLMDGDEVVELYLTDMQSTVPMPEKQLRGFKNIRLAIGQSTTVTLSLTADELYYFNEVQNTFDIEPGEFRVKVGGSSDNLPLEASLQVTDGVRKPDLLITNIRTVPRYPVRGDSVLFLATVKNQGSKPLPGGTPLKVSFRVNGQEVVWADTVTSPILPGSMVLLCANKGPSTTNIWKADTTGTFAIQAVVDPANTIDECIETNDTATASLEVRPKPAPNLALHCPVTVTSVEGAGLEGNKAVDGNSGSRWSSAFSDPQSITIDLGAQYLVDHVILRWEAAYGKDYSIFLSDNNTIYVTAASVVNGDGGNDTIPLERTGRYIRLLGTKRATQWGYSLYEFEVYGSIVTGVEESGTSLPSQCELFENYPNPFNPTTVIRYSVPPAAGRDGQVPGVSNVRIAVFDMLGREVKVLVNERKQAGRYEVTFDGAGLSSGPYIYRMMAGPFMQSRKMLLIK